MASVAEFLDSIDRRVTSNQNAVTADVNHASQRIEAAFNITETYEHLQLNHAAQAVPRMAQSIAQSAL